MYSGKVERDLSIGIGIYYAFASLLISFVAIPNFNIDSNSIKVGSGREMLFILIVRTSLFTAISIALFVTGIYGNFYHHNLLALIDSNTNNKHVSPKSGLFERTTLFI